MLATLLAFRAMRNYSIQQHYCAGRGHEAQGSMTFRVLPLWHSVARIKICTPQCFSRSRSCRTVRYTVSLRFCKGGGRVLHLLLLATAVRSRRKQWGRYVKECGISHSGDAGVPEEKGDIRPSSNEPSEISIACIPGGFHLLLDFSKKAGRYWYDHGREKLSSWFRVTNVEK